jgi:hypothetical protein
LNYEKKFFCIPNWRIQEQNTSAYIQGKFMIILIFLLPLAKLNLNTFDWNHPVKAKNKIDSSLQQISKAIVDLSDLSKGMNSELII